MKFIEYLEKNTLDTKTIQMTDSWLSDHMSDIRNVLPVRATGKFGEGLNARKHRGRIIELSAVAGQVVFSDNELAVWLYLNLPRLQTSTNSLEKLLRDQLVPVADSRAKSESDGKFLLSSVGRPWSNIRHSHIFDAGISLQENISRASREQVISRFLRLTHPINHFLFPDNLMVSAEQTSDPRFQHVAAVFMKKRVPDVFERYLKNIQPGVCFPWPTEWESIGNEWYDLLVLPSLKSTISPAPDSSSKTIKPKISNLTFSKGERMRLSITPDQIDKAKNGIRSMCKKYRNPRARFLTDVDGWIIEVEGINQNGETKLTALIAGGAYENGRLFYSVDAINGRTGKAQGNQYFLEMLNKRILDSAGMVRFNSGIYALNVEIRDKNAANVF